jgi:hypothetical protein
MVAGNIHQRGHSMKHIHIRTGSALLVSAAMIFVGCTDAPAADENPQSESDLRPDKSSTYYGPVNVSGPAAETLGAGKAAESTAGKCSVIQRVIKGVIDCALVCTVIAGSPGSPLAGPMKPAADVIKAYNKCLAQKRKVDKQVENGVKKPEAPQQFSVDWEALWSTARDLPGNVVSTARDLPGNVVKGTVIVTGTFLVLVWNGAQGIWELSRLG